MTVSVTVGVAVARRGASLVPSSDLLQRASGALANLADRQIPLSDRNQQDKAREIFGIVLN